MFMPTNVQAEEATDVAQEVLEARTGVLRINVGAKVTGNTDATLIQVGSGFLIGTEDGDQRVITNYHVVDAANSINEFAKDTNTPVKNIKRVIQVVIASNDVSVDAELEQSSEANDIAILKLKKNIYNSKCFSLSSKANLQETQTVYALGYPYEQTTYGQDFSKLKNEDVTIEKGAVSKFTTKGGTNVIVNSAQISKGNSGGPLVDSQGNVVGVNSYTLGTSDGGNYYYAIEIDTVREMLDALGIQYTSADGSTQGANVQEETDATQEAGEEETTESQPEVDKSALDSAISDAGDIDQSKYTEDSFKVFEEELESAKTVYTIKDKFGKVYAHGTVGTHHIPIGNLYSLGSVDMTLEGIDTPQKLNLEVRIEGCDAVNDWDFWVYPAQVELVQGTVYTTDTLDAKALAVLQDGGNVLITAAGKIQYGKEVKQYFTPVFWNTSWFKMRPPHTTGIFLNEYHPLFREFPTEYHSNLQWWELLNKAQVMQFTDFPATFQPTVQSIDTWFISRKIGMLFEAKVLNGKLMMTSMDITSQPEKRIVARQMHKAILNYMNSDAFRPADKIAPELIQALFTKVAGDVKSYTKDSPDELKPKIN